MDFFLRRGGVAVLDGPVSTNFYPLNILLEQQLPGHLLELYTTFFTIHNIPALPESKSTTIR